MVGSGAPCWARYMKMVTGSSVSDEALSTRNRICALLAVVLLGFSSCSARMAFSQSAWRRCPGPAVGGEVHGNQAQGRVAGRYLRHQPGKQRAQHLGQPFDDTGLLGDLQKAQPQGQGAEQQHHHLDRQLGHGKDAFDHCREDASVAAYQPLGQGGHRRHQEKAKPKAVEHPRVPPEKCSNDSVSQPLTGDRRRRVRPRIATQGRSHKDR